MPELKEFLLATAEKAGGILAENYGKIAEIRKKGEKDLVTNVDFLSEHCILDCIRESGYAYPTLGEETGKTGRGDSDYLWVIDPLDGTLNYVAGLPLFCVSIALQYKEEVIAGVTHAPLLNETYYAEKNKGAFLNGKKIRVNQKKSLSEALVYCGMGFSGDRLKEDLKCLQDLTYSCNRVYRLGTAALGLAYVACGKLDAAEFPETNVWDVAAGALLVGEAGGVNKELDGSDWTPSSTSIVSGSGVIVDRIVEMIE